MGIGGKSIVGPLSQDYGMLIIRVGTYTVLRRTWNKQKRMMGVAKRTAIIWFRVLLKIYLPLMLY